MSSVHIKEPVQHGKVSPIFCILLQAIFILAMLVISVLAQIVEEHNKQRNRLNLVLFDDVLEHLTRVHRVLRMHKGHIMIVGEGGSGKQSILRLAAFAAGTDRDL